jgi:hypothetical protein
MNTTDDLLPSWRPGTTRDAIVGFLDRSDGVAVEERFACFDNDGTLWCERPSYIQFDFFVDALRTRVAADPVIGDTPEFAAVLGGDRSAVADIGLERIALALAGLFSGIGPDQFTSQVRQFLDQATNATLERPLRSVTYQPMLELISELRRRDFTVAIVTGGGTEFVRAVSQDLYGVPPELVVGTLVQYEFTRDGRSRPELLRTGSVQGAANEGAIKVTNIQTQLGRRPILAAGNSGGDREMLEWAAAGEGASLALLIDHDDDEREFAYVSTAGTFVEAEPITGVGARLGWTVVSMANDWNTVFAPPQPPTLGVDRR